MRLICALLLASSIAACCPPTQQGPAAKNAADEAQAAPAAQLGAVKLPPFVLAALQGPHARKLKLYLKPDGSLRKVAVYVAKAGIPDWVHAMADKELGQGEEDDYEVEQYEDGDTVYEVTRKVGGKEVELSVHSETRKKLYTEQEGLPLSGAPAAVQKAAAGVAGFSPDAQGGLEVKSYADRKVYEVGGKRGGRAYSVELAEDGAILGQAFELQAEVEVGR